MALPYLGIFLWGLIFEFFTDMRIGTMKSREHGVAFATQPLISPSALILLAITVCKYLTPSRYSPIQYMCFPCGALYLCMYAGVS